MRRAERVKGKEEQEVTETWKRHQRVLKTTTCMLWRTRRKRRTKRLSPIFRCARFYTKQTVVQYFSEIDLRWGFYQVKLKKSSRHLTTFVANDKLYRYRRLPFGISSAPELYQKIIRDVIRDLSGEVDAANDILVYGPTQAEHDERLVRLLERLQHWT